MGRQSRRDVDAIDNLIASIRPVSRESLRTRGIAQAQDEIIAAIVSSPRRSFRGRGWEWLAAPRRLMLVGALVAGLGGGVAAAATLLSAHTRKYPTSMGIPLALSGPGEDLNTEAPDFCRVALQLTSDVPFPARYASWRTWVLTWEYGIEHVTSRAPCGSHDGGYVTTGWLGAYFATSAFCAWSQAWAHDVAAGNRIGAAYDAEMIGHAQDWAAIKAVDPSPDAATAGDGPLGTRTKTPFGWILSYQRAVRAGDRMRVEQLIAGVIGYGECLRGLDPDLLTFAEQHGSAAYSEIAQLMLQHLRAEGV